MIEAAEPGPTLDWASITRMEREGRLPGDGAAPLSVQSLLRLQPVGSSRAKILYVDIECSPNTAHVWGLWDQNIGLAQLKQSARIMGFSYRWYGANTTARWVGENNTTRMLMLQALKWLYCQADVVVTYNGNSFDHKVINAELVSEGIDPPSQYQSLDLYRVVAKNFRFPSKKLAYVAQQLIADTKIQTGGHELWNQCLDPNVDEKTRRIAWRLMSRYCNQDVNLMVPLHQALLPWMGDTVNIAFIGGKTHGCPKCGHSKLTKRGFTQTGTRRYQRFQCPSCRGWTRGNKSIQSFRQDEGQAAA